MPDSDFTYDRANWSVTEEMKQDYQKNGYVVIRNVLRSEELAKIKNCIENNKTLQEKFHTRADGEDSKIKSTLWRHPTKGVTGALVTMERVAGTMQELMGGDELYHYHSKLMMKNARDGGANVWHQDYGYWYDNYCLYPEMGSVFIPIDDCTRQNGCLQVLKGSHHMGRVDHGLIGEQRAADPERVEQAKKRLPHIYMEMKAGDILYFHGNLLHGSDANKSDKRRWVLIVAYNKRKNDPYKEHHMPRYTPMTKVPDSSLMDCNDEDDFDDEQFMKLKEDMYMKNHMK